MLNWSNRRQGSCPQCRSPYSSRSTCSTCGNELGGSTSAKVPKLSCPLAVRVHGHGDLFSTRTSTRDDRCFVLKEGDFWICLHTECKNLRAMYVSSSLRTQTYFRLSLHFAEVKRQPEIRLRSQAMYRATGLRTLHVRTLKVCQTAWTPVGLTAEKIASYPSDISKLSF